MLFILMHNKVNYLNTLSQVALRNGITETRIIKKNDLGLLVTGAQPDLFFRNGAIDDEYGRAFICTLQERQVKPLLGIIEKDPELNFLNQKQEGFICVLPFEQIDDLRRPESVLGSYN